MVSLSHQTEAFGLTWPVDKNHWLNGMCQGLDWVSALGRDQIGHVVISSTLLSYLSRGKEGRMVEI